MNKYVKLFEDINWNKWNYEEEEPISNEFIGHERFYDFLKENNCLNEWIYEMNKIGKDIKEYLDRRKKLEFDFYDFIANSFDWSVTNEGYFFWEKIRDKGINKY